MNNITALGVCLQRFSAYFSEFIDGFIVDLREEFFGAKRLVADLLDPFEVFREFSYVLSEKGLHFFDELIEEHFHDSEIVFELVHDLITNVVIDEQLVLLFGEGFAIDLSLFQPDVALVCDHALPL